MIEKTCVICGSSYAVKPYRHEQSKCCSKTCGWKYTAQKRSSPVETRFWGKVDKRRPDECWPWVGATTHGGYGVIGSHGKYGKLIRANRLSYEIHNGPIPDGMIIRHTCDNPICVNPAHLLVGTMRQNTQDMIERKRINPRYKVTEEQLQEIRDQLASGVGVREVGRRFNVSNSFISFIKNNKRRVQRK